MRTITGLPGLLLLGCILTAPAMPLPAQVDPGTVAVMVLGSPHLRDTEPTLRPPSQPILDRLIAWAPDLIAVEWLHPSIDPATTGNYRRFEDFATLARLWGIDLVAADSLLAYRRDQDAEKAQHHLELGKLHYLNHDRLNAGYHWWLAEQLGADVTELERLTSRNFAGHELAVWGFATARAHDHQYLTPFDYQGDDGAWIWDEIVMAVAAHAISSRHGLTEADSGFVTAFEGYANGLQARMTSGDTTWFAEYGGIPEVAEFTAVVDEWTARRTSDLPDSLQGGLPMMRYNQSSAAALDSRYLYDNVFAKITLDNLGQRLVDNWLRRNERMVDFVVADLDRLGGKKVLIIVGEGHKVFLDQELARRGFQVGDSRELIP